MVELLDVEKLIHLFVQNLTFQVSPSCNKKLDRVNFISCIDVACRTNLEFLRIGEKSKDIAMNGTLDLDIADVRSVRNFIETQTKFLDKFVYPNNIPLLTCHFDRINKKIVQKINETDQDAKEREIKYYKNKSSQVKEQKLKRTTVDDNRQICDANVKRTDACLKESNFIESIAERTRQEAVLNEEYLQLYINDVEFMKNVHVTLYVASKVI